MNKWPNALTACSVARWNKCYRAHRLTDLVSGQNGQRHVGLTHASIDASDAARFARVHWTTDRVQFGDVTQFADAIFVGRLFAQARFRRHRKQRRFPARRRTLRRRWFRRGFRRASPVVTSDGVVGEHRHSSSNFGLDSRNIKTAGFNPPPQRRQGSASAYSDSRGRSELFVEDQQPLWSMFR